MKRFEELKKRIDSLEDKYKGFKEGIDYTVSTDNEGNKVYDIRSEELRKSVFGNYREEEMIYPRRRGELENNQSQQTSYPANIPNTPFWNEVCGESNEFGFRHQPKISLLEKDKREIKNIPRASQEVSSQLPKEQSKDYQKWLEQGSKHGWLVIPVVIPILYALFFSPVK